MTTKYNLLCAVFLGIAILVVSAQPSQYTIEEIPKEEYDKFVMDLNNKKRAMVKRMNISQGYELMWDPELVKQLNEILLNGKKILDTKNRTYYREDSFDKLSQVWGKQVEEKEEQYNFVINIKSVLTPIHETVGCVRFRWTGDSRSVGCFFAPGYFFAHDSDRNYRTIITSATGVPGSSCKPGYTNKDGLCSLIDTKPPGIDVTDATDVTSGSSSTCFLIGFLLFVVSFYSSY